MNVVLEIPIEAARALRDQRGLLLLLVLGAGFALLLERLLRRRNVPRRARAAAAVLAFLGAAGAGLYLGWQTAFLCDDAYISFRYARNFAGGHGLVWNKGEWVEGYTNFLWTALLGLAGKLGADIPLAALAGCLASFVLALAATAATVRRAAPRPPVLPFAVIALAGAVPFHTFATSGLETMPAAALVAAAMYTSTLRRRAALLTGLALTAATLMRPDHVLFYATFGLAIALEDLVHGAPARPGATRRQRSWALLRRLDLRRYAAYLAPFFLIYVPYYLIRWNVYGDFYPNTYYAKSADQAYWSQGSLYVLHFTATSGAWVWVWTALVALAGGARTRNETRLRLFTLLVVPLFTVYIAKVGGDFMEHRFFVPLLPVTAAAAEIGLRFRLARPHRVWSTPPALALAALGMALALVPVHLIKGRGIRWNIAHEPGFYRVKSLSPLVIDCPWDRLGKELYAALTHRGVEPPLAAGAIGLLGYHSRLPLIDGLGLTNRAIAHKTIKGRGRPGHEKVASVPEVIQEGAVVDVGFRYDPAFKESALIRLGATRLYFLRFDPVWAERIGRLPGAHLPDPARDIEVLLRAAPRERVLAAWRFYRDFLAVHPRRDELLAGIEQRLSSIADFEDDLPPEQKRAAEGLRVERRDRPAGVTGDAWLASLPDGKKKGRTGRLDLPLGPLFAEEIRFALGGAPSTKISVQLVVNGEAVRRAAPTGEPGLVPVVWNVEDLLGETAALVIEDSDPAPGKGLFIDAIHVPPPSGDVRERIAAQGAAFDPAFGELLREARLLLPPDDPDRGLLERRVAQAYSLDTLPQGVTLSGGAFGKGPVKRAMAGQEAVGFEGTGFLDSFHGGDPAKGKVTFPEIVLPRVPVLALIAGGQGCGKVFVGLEVDGKVVQRACGKNDGLFRREELRTGSYAGRRGRIVIVDDADGGWGHILVDDIVIPR